MSNYAALAHGALRARDGVDSLSEGRVYCLQRSNNERPLVHALSFLLCIAHPSIHGPPAISREHGMAAVKRLTSQNTGGGAEYD